MSPKGMQVIVKKTVEVTAPRGATGSGQISLKVTDTGCVVFKQQATLASAPILVSFDSVEQLEQMLKQAKEQLK